MSCSPIAEPDKNQRGSEVSPREVEEALSSRPPWPAGVPDSFRGEAVKVGNLREGQTGDPRTSCAAIPAPCSRRSRYSSKSNSGQELPKSLIAKILGAEAREAARLFTA